MNCSGKLLSLTLTLRDAHPQYVWNPIGNNAIRGYIKRPDGIANFFVSIETTEIFDTYRNRRRFFIEIRFNSGRFIKHEMDGRFILIDYD